MKIKNREIPLFIEFLLSLSLKGKESRFRTRLIKILATRVEEFKEEHLALLQEYTEKDSNNEMIYHLSDGVKHFKINNREEFQRLYAELAEEYYYIEKNENTNDMIQSVKDSVIECDSMFSGEQAIYYDRWCDIVEDI